MQRRAFSARDRLPCRRKQRTKNDRDQGVGKVTVGIAKGDPQGCDRDEVDLRPARETAPAARLAHEDVAGSLSEEERAELEEYLRVNNELMILQSKARLSLQEFNRKAKR